jgi:Tol biopolymer transport system component/DNA-binding winged helix-turn-helix (wHTH) protein
MHEPAVREPTVRFGPFEFDAHSGELRKGPTLLKVPYQSVEILKALLERPGELVTREQLRERLWPSDTFVDFEHGVNAAVRRIREALGDSADAPKYIETLPRRGYRFIATVESASAVAIPQPVQAHRSRIGLAAAIVAVVAVLALWIGWSRRSSSSSAQRVPPASIPVTSFQGVEADPDLSPDGNQVAFARQRDTEDNLNVYVMSVDSGEPIPLTTNPANERSPTWSPDGNRIAFLRETRTGSAVVVIPALGGGEKIVTETQVAPANGASRSHGLSWTHDGASIFIVDRTASGYSAIFSCSIKTGERRQVTHPAPDAVDTAPAVSPNGRYLAFVRGIGAALGPVFVQQLDSPQSRGEPRQLTHEPRTRTLAWTPDSTRIVYDVGDLGGLWRVAIDGGSPEAVLTNVPAAKPSISRDGRLVYQYNLTDSNIWRMPGPEMRGRQELPPALEAIVASTGFDSSPQFSPDGSRIAFVSGRTGDGPQIWVADSDGSKQTRLTSINGEFLGSPRWSPNQKLIAFDSRHSGHWNIYVVGVEDGRVAAVTADTFINVRPSWSADGHWIYFTSNHSGEPQIWKVAAAGGQPIQVTRKGGFEAFESAEGLDLYYAKQATPGIWRVPVQGGDEVQVLDRGRQMSWGLTQHGIALMDSFAKPRAKVEFFRFGSLPTVASVVELPGGVRLSRSPYFTVSRDGQWVMFPLYDQWGSDIHKLQGSW